MYLNDLKMPGRLDQFRWGHFLLLAVNYSLFFILFTLLITGKNLTTLSAFLVAAVVSFPLLMFHVARSWGTGFAVKYILPLTLFTLAIVFNGVYGAGFRLYGFLILFVFTTAFFTITYRTWSDKLKAHKREIQKKNDQQIEKKKNDKIEKNREESLKKERISLKRKVSAVISKGNSLFNSAQNLENQVTILFMTEDDILNKSRTTMNNCLSTITDLRTSHYKIREDFDELNEITELSEYKTNCSSMEKKDKQVQIQLEQTYKLLKSTTDQINQEREKKRIQSGEKQGIIHCISCGYAFPLANFCPECGIKSPVKLTCGNCGDTYMLPLHSLGKTKPEDKVCCLTCGQPHNFKFPEEPEQEKEDDQ